MVEVTRMAGVARVARHLRLVCVFALVFTARPLGSTEAGRAHADDLSPVAGTATVARPEARGAIRVVSWNVWGVPWVTPDLDARMAEVAPALAELEPDVVALQEVWTPEHGAKIIEALAARGLTHAIHYHDETERQQAGLLVASRWPIEEVAWLPFRTGGMPLVPWHVDYMANKGVSLVRVHAPRPFILANTHLQAAYGPVRYTVTRLSQALELAMTLDAFDEPVVVAADLNAHDHELPFRALRARARLEDAAPGFGIDAVLHRGGFRTLGHHRALDGDVTLANGATRRLSDHDALVVDLAPTARVSLPALAWSDVRGEAAAYVRSAGVLWSGDGSGLRFAGLFLLALVVARWRRRRAVLLGLTAAGLLYVGFFYGPNEHGELRRMLDEISAERADVEPAARRG